MSIDHLEHLRVESARFEEVLARAAPDSPVPSCAGWTASDLLWHLGEVQHSWGTIVRDRLTDPESYEQPARPERYDDLLAFFRTSSAMLVDALARTTDEVPVWTWFDADQSVGFVRRRQAHEALIHRLDAELVIGDRTGFDAELATDGVLEAIECMFAGAPAWASTSVDGPVGRITTSDTGVGWTVQIGSWSGTSPNTGTTYVDEPMVLLVTDGQPSFEIIGAAGDLDAWVWNRPALGEIVLEGDTSAFEAVIRTGVQ